MEEGAMGQGPEVASAVENDPSLTQQGHRTEVYNHMQLKLAEDLGSGKPIHPLPELPVRSTACQPLELIQGHHVERVPTEQ